MSSALNVSIRLSTEHAECVTIRSPIFGQLPEVNSILLHPALEIPFINIPTVLSGVLLGHSSPVRIVVFRNLTHVAHYSQLAVMVLKYRRNDHIREQLPVLSWFCATCECPTARENLRHCSKCEETLCGWCIDLSLNVQRERGRGRSDILDPDIGIYICPM